MAEPCILPLPTSLVLLLHLHIMLYPHCNSPEYLPASLFVPRRPLRERTKTMEDIVAFLIEKIEGREKCKSVLGGIYPCLQPSDMVKFRANAAKYIETLRANVTRSLASKSRSAPLGHASEAAFTSSKAISSKKSASRSCKPQPSSLDHQPVAWWWTSVVVRKSLLEECSGDRFEKLLLALSTHALFVRIPPSSLLHPKTTTIPALTSDLQLQSQAYASVLSQSLELHEKRIHAVTRLNVRAQEIMSLRTRLALNPQDVVEKPDTKDLLAIRDSKWRGLVDAWETTLSGDRSHTDKGMAMATEDMLRWLMSLAGVSAAADQHAKRTSLTGLPPDADVSPQYPRISAIQSLPTASAHHPANVYRLGLLPTFVSLRAEESSDKQTSGTDSTIMSSPVLQELLDNVASQQSALKTALASAAREGREVSRRLDHALKTTAAAETRDVENKERKPELWIPGPMEGPKFGLPLTKTSAVLKFLDALHIAPPRDQECETQFQQRLETRVLALRDSLQPPIHEPVAPYEDPAQELPRRATPPIIGKHYQWKSKLPLAKSSLEPSSSESWPTPLTPRPYQTSTPPTKSRSKSSRAMKRTLQEMRSGSYQSPKPRNNDLTTDVLDIRINSGEHDGLRTPTDQRTSVPLCGVKNDSMIATRPGDMIADMSLPDFSEGSIIEHSSHLPGKDDGNWIEGFPRNHEDDDVPYEGHSITLRDILIRTGNEEDSFHLLCNGDDLEEGVGDETTGW